MSFHITLSGAKVTIHVTDDGQDNFDHEATRVKEMYQNLVLEDLFLEINAITYIVPNGISMLLGGDSYEKLFQEKEPLLTSEYYKQNLKQKAQDAFNNSDAVKKQKEENLKELMLKKQAELERLESEQAVWFYSDDAETQHGPKSLNELKALYKNKTISNDTLVWMPECEEWKRFESVLSEKQEKIISTHVTEPVLKSDALFETSTEQTNQTKLDSLTTIEDDQTEPVIAGRWKRYFARMFDVWLETMVVGLCVFFVAFQFEYFPQWVQEPSSELILGPLFMLLILILDTLIYAKFGNTPGKALLGIKVKTIENMPLSRQQYFRRNNAVYIFGFALGLPIFNLFSMAYQHGRLGKKKATNYDENLKFKVIASKKMSIAILIFALAGLLTFFASTMLSSMNNTLVSGNKSEVESVSNNLSSKADAASGEEVVTLETLESTRPVEQPRKVYSFTLKQFYEMAEAYLKLEDYKRKGGFSGERIDVASILSDGFMFRGYVAAVLDGDDSLEECAANKSLDLIASRTAGSLISDPIGKNGFKPEDKTSWIMLLVHFSCNDELWK